MKLKNTFLVGIMSIVGLTSCLSEEFGNEGSANGKGDLVLDVDLVKPESRATTTVTNFPVVIYDADNKQVASYDKVSDVPAKITLGVGNYVVESHTPGAIDKKMAYPYYNGKKDAEILKGVTSQVEVLCKMQNSLITVNYDDEFKSVFSAWEITITDDSDVALSFTNTDLTNNVYWYFGENGAQELVVNFRGTTKDGSVVAARNVLTKDQADESYDDDREYFCGGDALNLNFTPTESTDGKIVGVTLSADVTFTETNENVNVNVIDKPGFEEGGEDNPDPTPGQGGDDANITLNLPQPISYPLFGADAVDKSLGDTYIAAENGLKSIKVKIESTSADMISSVGDLNTQYGVDFIHGAEIVGNNDVVRLFNDLNQPLSVPAEGAKEYTFPIGNFFGLLQVLQGEHTFILTVTDMNGNKKDGQVVITIQ